MEIILNGQKKAFSEPLTVAGLLDRLGIHPKSIVVEKNLDIVDRENFERETIRDGDTVEIIRLVGGG